MDDLYTRFNREFSEKVQEVRKLLSYLADSYYGNEADLVRIRTTYREVMDFKLFYITKNSAIKDKAERAPRKDFQMESDMAAFIGRQVDPFVELFHFIIEMYEEGK